MKAAAAGSLLVALLVALLVGGTGAPAAGAERAGLCARFGAGSVAGTVADDGLVEASGLAASRAHPGVLWAHDDSGGGPELHALAPTGEALGSFRVAGAESVDWEDMAVGPGPDPESSYLYVGDIGDNGATRPFVTVYRVPEPAELPDGTGSTLHDTEVIRLRYPGGPLDAEALLVDPRTGDLLVLTKELTETSSGVLRAPADSLRDGAEVTLEAGGRFEVPLPDRLTLGLPAWVVTGADISPDGDIVLVRTYRSVLAFERRPGEPIADAFSRPPCQAPQSEESQGEAVAFAADGRAYFTVGEGEHVPVHRFEVAAAPVADAPAGDAPPTEPAASNGGDDRSWWPLVLGGVVAVAAVAAVAAVVARASGRGRAGPPRTRASRRP